MQTASVNPLATAMHAQAHDRYLTVEGARLRYRDQGSGPAVLLVHGWALDLEMWNALAAALCGNFRVLRLDRRGFGLSSGLPSLEHDISDLDALLRHLGVERAALLGMSQGARAALGLAAIAGGRICCLVLDGPPPMGRSVGTDAEAEADADTGDVPLVQYRALLRAQGIDAVRREWAAHPLTALRTGDRNTRQLLQAIIRRYPGNDLRQPAGQSADAMRQDTAIVPESIATPVLVITGEHDLAARVSAAQLLARRLADAERVVVADAGHLPNLDNPLAYNNLVRAFLQRHSSARTQT